MGGKQVEYYQSACIHFEDPDEAHMWWSKLQIRFDGPIHNQDILMIADDDCITVNYTPEYACEVEVYIEDEIDAEVEIT